MNLALRLTLNLIAAFIATIAIAKIAEFFGVPVGEYIIFYAWFLALCLFFIFLPAKYDFFSDPKLIIEEPDSGGNKPTASGGIIGPIFDIFNKIKNRIPNLNDSDVARQGTQGVLQEVIPPGSGLPEYTDPQGPLEFLSSVFEPNSDLSVQEKKVRELLPKKIGKDITFSEAVSNLATIQGNKPKESSKNLENNTTTGGSLFRDLYNLNKARKLNNESIINHTDHIKTHYEN